MSQHPLNLALRFFLEIAALVCMGYWASGLGTGLRRVLLVILIPLAAASLWGIFRVPNDPGKALVAVPGLMRLALEIAFFGFAVWSLQQSGQTKWAWIYGLIVLGHYLISYDRVGWLMRQ